MAGEVVKGLQELEVNLGKVKGIITQNSLANSLEAGYFIWEGAAKVLIQTSPASGRMYSGHRASAPGQPPATDTGALVNNWPRPSKSFRVGGAEVAGGPGQEYAIHLELGTVKMDPRPFMRPALDENVPEINRAVQRDLHRKIEAAL